MSDSAVTAGGSISHIPTRLNILGRIQRAMLILGILLLGVYGGAHLHRVLFSRAALTQFGQLREVGANGQRTPDERTKVDFSLWSPKRISEYRDSLAARLDPPLAVLRIPRLGLEVPVLEGTDDLILNRGVGHISGTSAPGDDGNIGIAGHRDGFFRVLKDIAAGDRIELILPKGTQEYVVDQIVLVKPEDVSVLQPRTVPSLTLVTCYPFYYIGSAPQRYIVQASIVDRDRAANQNSN